MVGPRPRVLLTLPLDTALSENGRVAAGERHGMCESAFKTAGERLGMCESAFKTAGERYGMCESA
jgi:hypothetical protein